MATGRQGRHMFLAAVILGAVVLLGSAAGAQPAASGSDGEAVARAAVIEPGTTTSGFESVWEVTIAGADLTAAAVGDVDGDGTADIVVVSDPVGAPSELLTFPADTGPSSVPVTSYPLSGTRSESVAVGDLNGDGLDDVAVAIYGIGVEVFLQDDGALVEPIFYPTANSRLIRFGHLDNDADLDIVGIAWGSDTATVLWNNGSGRFTTSSDYPIDIGGYDDLEVGDVTGDGKDDIVAMSGQIFAIPNLNVLAQTDDGFAPAATYALGDQILSGGIGLGDVTGDGLGDVVISYGGNRPSSFIAVMPQTATGDLGSPVRYPSYDIPEPVEVADFTGDGLLDVAVAHRGWSAIGLYEQDDTTNLLGVEVLYAMPITYFEPHAMTTADLFGNAAADLVTVDRDKVVVHYATANVGPLCDGLPATVNLNKGEAPTNGNDVIVGTPGPDVIYAGGGDDVVCAGAGADVVVGGDGDDTILGGPGSDVLSGNGGNDDLRGGDGDDRAFGGSGADEVSGDADDDVVGGGSGRDRAYGGDGDDGVSGGSGDDAAVHGGDGDDAVNGGRGNDGDVLGGTGSDTVSGNGGQDVVRGGPGNDQVRGGPNDDRVFGDSGDDLVAGNQGFDLCDGGPDTDVAAPNCETTINVP